MKTINDDMKKESKGVKKLMLFCLAFAIIEPVAIYFQKPYGWKQGNLFPFFGFFIIFLWALYTFFWTIKYVVIITQEKVVLKTLFVKKEIIINDITRCIVKKYSRKSVFYGFILFTKDKNIKLYTRYKDEFIKFLNENKIELILK